MTALVTPEAVETTRHRVFEFRAESGSDGKTRVEGYASVWGSRNSFGECFVPGCYQAHLDTRDAAHPLIMGYNHHPFAPTPPIGRWEVPPSGETERGLFLSGPISETDTGREAATLASDGVLTGLSIGFDPFDLDYVYARAGQAATFETPFGRKTYQFEEETIYIVRCVIGEASLVPNPSDDEARITAVRTAVGAVMEKAQRAMPGLASGAPWDDVAFSMALLMGGRGSAAFVDLPDLQHRSVYEQLSAGYSKHGKTPPEYRRRPSYGDVEFQHDERSIFQDRYLRKTLVSVNAGLRGIDGELSDDTQAEIQQCSVLCQSALRGKAETVPRRIVDEINAVVASISNH